MLESHLKVKYKATALVIALIGADNDLEVQQIIWVGKVCVAGARKVQLVDV